MSKYLELTLILKVCLHFKVNRATEKQVDKSFQIKSHLKRDRNYKSLKYANGIRNEGL